MEPSCFALRESARSLSISDGECGSPVLMSYAFPTLVTVLLKTTVVSSELGPTLPPVFRIAVKHGTPAGNKTPSLCRCPDSLQYSFLQTEELLHSLIFADGSVTMEVVCSSLCGPDVDPRLSVAAFISWIDAWSAGLT